MGSTATQRVIALVDMDCFYCQVESRLDPKLKGKPLAVVQYDQSWKGGGIIAVNYEARDKGVSRYMRGTEAKDICPEIVLVAVPTVRGKADLTNYRDAGDEVAKVFSEFSERVQRASIDEAYIDLTKAVQDALRNQNEEIWLSDLPNTFVVGYSDLQNSNESDRRKGLTQWLNKLENEKTDKSADYQLAVGAKIVEKMRSEILKRTGFHCSAGIAHNKILAKLCAGLHKPKGQTILPQDAVPELYETLPVQKVRNLGGKLGQQVIDKLSINYMSELYNFSLSQLQQKFDEKTSMWLYNIARGIDLDPVTSRLTPESIGCCKNFRGKSALKTKSEVQHWLRELASEISERLTKDSERNSRRAMQLTVSFCQNNSMSRCGPLTSYEVSRIASDAMELLKKFNHAPANGNVWTPPITYLGLTAGKFMEVTSNIGKYLKSKGLVNSVKSQDSPHCSKTQKEHHYKEESEKQSDIVNCSFKKTEKRTNNNAFNVDNNILKQSFFLEFLNSKRQTLSEEEAEEAETEAETWISLSELFPDVNEAEPEVVENLPEPLQEKFKKLLNGSQVKSENLEALKNYRKTDSGVETCQECGANIPTRELSIHLDYHAALKIYSEVNRPAGCSAAVGTIDFWDKECMTKRKKKGASSPSKKIRSLKCFFAPLAKE